MTDRERYEKQSIINACGNHNNDTGSRNVQIGLLEYIIKKLKNHVKVNPKDFTSIRALKMHEHKLRKLIAENDKIAQKSL